MNKMSLKFVPKLKLITFDVTGTLIKFRIPPPLQYVAVGKMHGVYVNAAEMASNFKVCFKQMNNEHPNFGKISGIGWEKWWHELVCRAFLASSKDQDIESSKLDSIARHLIHGYSSGVYYELYPDVSPSLKFLKTRRYLMGVISNNDDRLTEVLKNFNLLQYFDFVLTSYSTGFQKPAKEIFQKALEPNGVQPFQAFHIGNSPELDFFAAIDSGWNAGLINLHDREKVLEKYPTIPSYLVFKNFQELIQILKQF